MPVCSWGYAAGVPGSLGAYRSPLDDAYHNYALQNPYAAGIGTCKFVLLIFISSLGSRGSGNQTEFTVV